MIPKFRAWDKDKEWMVYDVQDTYDGLWSERNSDEVNDYYGYASTFQSFTDEEDFNFMQYTGLKDKNGVDVFEGDYLSWVSFESHKEFKGEVVFSKGSFCMVVGLKGHNYKVPLHELSDSDSLIEVLGNVYEHPELLEEVENER